jgi:hypothetical protein
MKRASTLISPGTRAASRTAALLIALSILAAGAWLASARPTAAFEALFSEEFRLYNQMVDSAQRQWAHRVFIVAIPLIMFLGGYLKFDRAASRIDPLVKLAMGRGALFVVGLLGVATIRKLPSASLNSFPDSSFAQMFIPSRITYAMMVLGGLAVVLLLARGMRWLDQPRQRRRLWLLVLAFAACASLPGLLTPVPTHRVGWQMLLWMDIHHSAVLGEALRLADGQAAYLDFRVFYGLLRQALLALWIRLSGPLDWGDLFRVVQWTQVAYIALVLWAYYLWKPAKPRLALFAVLLVVPWVHPLHVGIGFPNQSAVRHLGLPAAAVLLLYARRWPLTATAWRLGAAAAVLMFFNLETGIAASFGFLVFGLHRAPSLKAPVVLGLAARFALSAILAAITLALCIVLFAKGGYSVGAWRDLGTYLADSAGGFGGKRWTFSAVFLLIAGHTLWISIRLALRRSDRPSGPETAFLAAIAAATFVWLAYYINGPDPWNLWSMLFPYSFVAAAAFLNRHVLSGMRGDGKASRKAIIARSLRLRPLAFAVLLAPLIFSGNWNMVTFLPRHFYHAMSVQARSAARISGLPLSAGNAAVLERKAAALRDLAARTNGRLAYLTTNAISMPLLAGRGSGVWARDPFSEVHTPRDYARLAKQLAETTPLVIAFDDASVPGLWFPEEARRYLERIKGDIAGRYTFVEKRDYWEIWALKP